MADTVNIIVNGIERTVAEGTSVESLIHEISPDGTQGVAVEINAEFIEPPKYSRTVCEGDAIEIVRFVGGG